jgi:hypothetical protein
MSEGDVLHLLIKDEQGTATVDINMEGETIDVVPVKPVIQATTDITPSTFTANWILNENTVGYYIDVSEDSTFGEDPSITPVLDNYDVGNVVSYVVTGLQKLTTYYCRIRAYNNIGSSADSDTAIGVTIGMLYTDWFLPSRNELNSMYTELKVHGVGDFTSLEYWSSSEFFTSDVAYWQNFNTGGQSGSQKYEKINLCVRACRSFTSVSPSYSLRDVGPAGGLIFYKSGSSYLEAAPWDQGSSVEWSNVHTGFAGTGTAIGTGMANSLAIIAQVGHVNSAAKLCRDLII